AVVGRLVGPLVWSLTGRLSGLSRDVRFVVSGVLGAAAAGTLLMWGQYQALTGFGVWGVLIAVPAVGLLLGAVSGVTTAKGRIQPFVATLAMMISAWGLARMIAGRGGRVHPIYFGQGQADPAFEVLRYKIPLAIGASGASVEVIPVPALIFVAVAIVSHVILSTQRFGRHVYAVGGNEEAARLSGIPVDRVKIATYAISGFLAGLAGVLFCAQYQQGKPDAGGGAGLDAIAAAVIGGTSLMGGRGRVSGTVVGVLIFGYLSNIFTLIGWPTDVQLALKGVIIVLAVLLQEGQLSRWARTAWLRLAGPSGSGG
ncbi:MAG: ABC transporter permease, partial [Armatimonadota bacterium]